MQTVSAWAELEDPQAAARRGTGHGGPGGGLERHPGPSAFTQGLSPLQMMMQYLYHGGTESMDIPTADILEVRTWPVCWARGPPVSLARDTQPGLNVLPAFGQMRGEGGL